MLRNFFTLGLGAAAFAAGTFVLSESALAEYPERPITWIVPWGAGGGTDSGTGPGSGSGNCGNCTVSGRGNICSVVRPGVRCG